MPFIPYARLLRLPNVFTAFADIALGFCVASSVAGDLPLAWRAVLLFAASGCLYLAGMVWNDYFDLEEDRKTQAYRPLASGKISVRTAVVIGIALTAVGLACATASGREGAIVGGLLVTAIFLYDARIKRTPAGPVSMAACRFLNVLLGLTLIDIASLGWPMRLHLAGTIALYIVGVTWFARTEEKRSDPRVLRLAALVMSAAVLLALFVPARLPAGTSWPAFPYLLVGFVFWVGMPIAAAIRQPTPQRVQAGVKRSIFGLVALDAILATAFVGAPGLLILLLLIPAILLGKLIYST